MIRLRISGDNFDPIIRMVDRVSHPDLTPLAETLRGIMIRDNREGLLAGTDSFGDPMTALEPSTIKRGRGGDGPPLVPRGDASRAISDYRVEVEQEPGRMVLTGLWPSTTFVHYHVTGTKYMVSRDPTGLRPDGQDRVRSALHDFAATLIGGSP